tara:strand:+ start:743 stop:1912 length:1170 start_codon:yes stop_codon:yes gene_type:complete
MAINKLMEAAADILAQSKRNAGSMPMQKMAGSEVEDLGGMDNKTATNPGDSIKVKATDEKGNHAKNVADYKMHPSAASASQKNEDTVEDEEVLEPVEDETVVIEAEEHDDEDKKDKKHSKDDSDDDDDDDDDDEEEDEKRKEKMKEDIDALFADDKTISEDFRAKASTIFEARVLDRVVQIEEEIEAKYAGQLEETVDAIKVDLTEKVDGYLSYVVEQWMGDNEIAIESGLRSELTEEFISGMRNLFAEHYIDVPAEKVDLVDELATKVEELESKLDEEIERGIEYKKELTESRKNEIAHQVTEGLIDTQVAKIKTLAESVEFSTEDEYKDKLESIRENYFPTGIKKPGEEMLHEEIESAEEAAASTAKQKSFDPFVNAVTSAISNTKK